MIKDLFEDLKRHKSDKQENNRKVQILNNGKFQDTTWEKL